MVIFICCLLGFGALEWFLHCRREGKLRKLNQYLAHIQDQLELPVLKECSEGQLGILESEIYKVVALLGEQSQRSKNQNAYLADMMADISHQIKTPLAGIVLLTDLLKNPELPQEKRLEYLRKIETQTEKITWLVRNLLTLSRLEAGALKLTSQEISVSELIQKALEPLEILAELKGIAVEKKIPAALSLSCDPEWTAEAISNILKNCMEHLGNSAPETEDHVENQTENMAESLELQNENLTEYCGIQIKNNPEQSRIRITASGNNLSVSIIIQDNGPGISPEELPHIFERFYQGTSSSVSGAGLGLAMAQKIFLLQNGSIRAASTPGNGTSFFLKMYVSANSQPDDNHSS